MSDLEENASRERILNIPAAALSAVAVLCLIHFARVYVLDEDSDRFLIWLTSFIPARFAGTPAASLHTLTSYSLLHGSWGHLINNCVWLVAFGSPVAAALGGMRFALFWIVCGAAAALVHFAADPASSIPMIGASGAVSGMMGAAARAGFRLRADAPGIRSRDSLPSMRMALSSANVQVFLSIYLVVNIGIGLGEAAAPGLSDIAWQAHIGGLVAGFFLFATFLRRS